MDKKLEQGLASVLRKTLGLKRIERSAIIEIVEYLDRKGMVWKIEGKLPEYQSRYEWGAYEAVVKKAGFSKTKRLIEE